MVAAARFVIRYRLGGGDWNERPLEEGELTFGRGDEAGVVLKHNLVSRLHARLVYRGNEFWLTDLGSTNGTTLDQVRLVAHIPYPVNPGQTIAIGDFKLQVVEVAPPQPEPQPQAPPVQVEAPPKPAPEAKEEPVSYVLNYRRGNEEWRTFHLDEEETVLGRNPDCQFVLDDREVSRRHVRVDYKDNRFWLLDLGATNGTQLEGEPLAPRQKYPIHLGQTFQVGSYAFYISKASQAAGKVDRRALAPRRVSITPGAPAVDGGEQAGVMTMMGGPDVLKTPEILHSLDLSQEERITIGRSQDNHVVLNHPLVSRYHAAIERVGGRYLLRDLRSSNGVFVNGNRITAETWLQEQDEIQIGPFVFILPGFSLRQKAETGLLLQVRGVKQFVTKQINLLQDINLVIQPFEFVAVVGMSGSGKTTLMNAISGYRPATHGHVLVNHTDLYTNYDLFRNDIGYVPQKDIVHTELTPESALDYVARLRMPPDTTPAERSAVVNEVLENLGLTERRHVAISRLSGGQLKRVSIGVELVTKPRLFYLDEPTSGLDPGTEYGMMKLMRRLADQGRTVMLVTHATKNVMLCDKVVFLATGGHVAFYGPPDEALQYFDEYRTTRERKEKQMEFDDIYRILSDDDRGSPAEWGKRYRNSAAYKQYAQPAETKKEEARKPASAPVQKARAQSPTPAKK